MKNAEYAALVRAVEADCRANPERGRRSAFAWALLGYGFVGGLLAVLVGLLVLGVWLMGTLRHGNAVLAKVMLVVAVAVLGILRALWVRFDPPEGLILTPEEAPELHEEVERLRLELQTPRIHQILATLDLNASLTQTPRLGPLGYYRNTLSVGLPLMEAMPASEFRAVLAHELGHASRSHGGVGAWIYRLHATYSKLNDHFASSDGLFDKLFKSFFEWWWPRFQARAIVTRREHEYEADTYASRLESGSALIRGLARLRVIGDNLNRSFWPTIRALSRTQAEPPEDLLARMKPALAISELADESLGPGWASEPSIGDSHPSLAQRASSLGVERFQSEALRSVESPASSVFLASARRALESKLSREWRDSNRSFWAVAFSQAQADSERIEKLEDAAASNTLTVEETVERALFAEEREGPEAALEWLRRALERQPSSVPALFHAGRLGLVNGDENAIAKLRAAAGEEKFRGASLALVENHLRESGRKDELAAIEAELFEHGDKMEAAAAERAALGEGDALGPHGLKEKDLSLWRAVLQARPDVKAAYLFTKEMRHFQSDARHVLVVSISVPWYRRTETIAAKALSELVAGVPGAGWVIILNQASRSYRTKLEIPSARIL